MDVAGLEKLSKQTILSIVMVLSFLAHGYATGEFEVTEERLGGKNFWLRGQIDVALGPRSPPNFFPLLFTFSLSSYRTSRQPERLPFECQAVRLPSEGPR
jgi:hypothetical protein